MGELETPIFKLPYPRTIGPVSLGAKDIQELCERLEAIQVELANSVYIPGDLKLAAYESVPTGWLACKGQSLLRATYPALFTALGGEASPWGLPDGTHFNVPSSENRIMIGVGAVGTGRPSHALGKTGGVETVTLTAAQSGLAEHSHGLGGVLFEPFLAESFPEDLAGGTAPAVGQHTGNAGPSAASTSHTNMPLYFVAQWLIKT